MQRNLSGGLQWLRRRMLSMVWLTLLLAWALPGRSQTELGSLTFLSVAAPELDAGFGRAQPRYQKADLGDCLGSLGFLNSIGGVAFAATADPNADWEIVDLTYAGSRPDGQRLQLQVRAKGAGDVRTVQASIPDWLLAPLARFAASPEFSCFTYFGALSDQAQERKVRASEGHILNYHSAFTNTLLGLRLMQLDLLLLYPDSAHIVEQKGRALLGTGEAEPDVAGNGRHLAAVQHYLSAEGQRGNRFQSYVVCDHGQHITWSVLNGRLVLAGDPVWYCWRYKPGVAGRFQEVQKEVNVSANEQLRREFERNPTMSQGEQHLRFSALFDAEASRRMVQAMPEFTEALSARIRAEQGINPLVYNAAAQTMRIAAFFRRVKSEQPAAWQKFAGTMAHLQTAPACETPTVLLLPAKYRHGLVVPVQE